MRSATGRELGSITPMIRFPSMYAHPSGFVVVTRKEGGALTFWSDPLTEGVYGLYERHRLTGLDLPFSSCSTYASITIPSKGKYGQSS